MKKILSVLVLLTALVSACGGGTFTKTDPVTTPPPADTTQPPSDTTQPSTDVSEPTTWGNASVTTNAFSLGSNYPSDITIPDVEGMRSTAFVISMSNPCGVVAIDLNANPLATSTAFTGMTCPDGIGMFPNSLYIMSSTRGFFLTESTVVDFNPTNGNINKTTDLVSGENYSSSGLTVSNNKLYVAMYKHDGWYTPTQENGKVKVFDISDGPTYLTENTTITPTGLNTTSVTTLPDNTLAITNSGAVSYDFVTWVASPLTDSIIDIVDTSSDDILTSINMGLAYLSTKQLAVTSDGDMAYIGSQTYGEAYSIDLVSYTAVNTHDADPIVVSASTAGSDYIPDVALSWDDKYLYVASFNNSKVYPVGLDGVNFDVTPDAFPSPFVMGFPAGVTAENPTGVNTGVGGIAVRPGIPAVDFTTADIYALTGNPGTVAYVKTYE